MIVENITTEVKYIALKTPFITALRKVENIEFVRVEILFDNGKMRFGEAPATVAITGESIDTILNSINKIKNKIVNKSIDEAFIILHNSSIGSSAKAAIDMALFRFEELNYMKKVLYTDITISLNKKEKMLNDSKAAFENNMPILKIKLGENINHAIEVTKLISKELANAKLLIDANQAWSLESSLKYIEAVKDLDIELIEQPVKANELNELKEISQKSNIKIMADESTFTLEDVKKVMKSKSADMINIKLMKCGGVTKAIEILEYARKNNIECMLGSMLEGPVSINAALHLALAYDDIIKYIDLDSPLLYKEPSDELDFEFNGYEIRLKT